MTDSNYNQLLFIKIFPKVIVSICNLKFFTNFNFIIRCAIRSFSSESYCIAYLKEYSLLAPHLVFIKSFNKTYITQAAGKKESESASFYKVFEHKIESLPVQIPYSVQPRSGIKIPTTK